MTKQTKLLLIQDNIGLKINMEENKDKKENSGKLQLKKHLMLAK